MDDRTLLGSQPEDRENAEPQRLQEGRPENEPPGVEARSQGETREGDTEVAQVRQTAEEAKRIANEVRFQAGHQEIELQQQDADLRSQRRRGVMAFLLLVALLAALVWYSYPLLKQHDGLLARFPAVQDSVAALTGRMDATEQKLQGWVSEYGHLGERMATVEKRVSQTLQTARKQAQEVALQVRQSLQEELRQGMRAMDDRLVWLETSQETDRVRLGKLQEEIASVRRDLTEQVAQVREETTRELADVSRQRDRDRRDLDGLADKLERHRESFEVAKKEIREVVPGVFVSVLGTNVSYQETRGWLRLVPEGRTLWFGHLGIQQPLVFYRQDQDRPYEMVLTRVSEDGAVGYVLMPGRSWASRPLAKNEAEPAQR